jgi:hypothetical protein
MSKAPTQIKYQGRIYKRAFDDEAMAPELKSLKELVGQATPPNVFKIKVDGQLRVYRHGSSTSANFIEKRPGVERWSCYDRDIPADKAQVACTTMMATAKFSSRR